MRILRWRTAALAALGLQPVFIGEKQMQLRGRGVAPNLDRIIAGKARAAKSRLSISSPPDAPTHLTTATASRAGFYRDSQGKSATGTNCPVR